MENIDYIPQRIFKKRKPSLKYIISHDQLLTYLISYLKYEYVTTANACEAYNVTAEEKDHFHNADSFKDVANIILNRDYWWESRF